MEISSHPHIVTDRSIGDIFLGIFQDLLFVGVMTPVIFHSCLATTNFGHFSPSSVEILLMVQKSCTTWDGAKNPVDNGDKLGKSTRSSQKNWSKPRKKKKKHPQKVLLYLPYNFYLFLLTSKTLGRHLLTTEAWEEVAVDRHGRCSTWKIRSPLEIVPNKYTPNKLKDSRNWIQLISCLEVYKLGELYQFFGDFKNSTGFHLQIPRKVLLQPHA